MNEINPQYADSAPSPDYALFFNPENEQFHFIEPIVVYG